MVAAVVALQGRRGASRLGCLLQLAIVACLIYVATMVGEDALTYYRFQDAMKNEARFAEKRSDQQIKDHLRAFTDSVKLPPSAQDINIVREENTIRIWAEYDQEFKLPFKYSKTVHLKPSAETTF
jgi:hypothetical protein